MDNGKKIYKSQTDKKLAGVCGGIAEYFGFDATWLRIALVVFTLAGGAGIFIYIIAAIVIPSNPGIDTQNQGPAQNQESNSGQGYTAYQEPVQNAAQETITTETWLCECGMVCNTPFCQQCGRKKPEVNLDNKF